MNSQESLDGGTYCAGLPDWLWHGWSSGGDQASISDEAPWTCCIASPLQLYDLFRPPLSSLKITKASLRSKASCTVSRTLELARMGDIGPMTIGTQTLDIARRFSINNLCSLFLAWQRKLCVWTVKRERGRERCKAGRKRQKVGDKTASQASSDVIMPFAAEGG